MGWGPFWASGLGVRHGQSPGSQSLEWSHRASALCLPSAVTTWDFRSRMRAALAAAMYSAMSCAPPGARSRTKRGAARLRAPGGALRPPPLRTQLQHEVKDSSNVERVRFLGGSPAQPPRATHSSPTHASHAPPTPQQPCMPPPSPTNPEAPTPLLALADTLLVLAGRPATRRPLTQTRTRCSPAPSKAQSTKWRARPEGISTGTATLG